MLNMSVAMNNHTLANKQLVIGITASIAAYKSIDVVRLLRAAGATVRVVMTQSAKAFITPLSLQAISGNIVYSDLMNPMAENGMEHIDLSRWADMIIIAPASANFIARLAHGFSDDLLSTLCMATKAPIILAPAMNQQMWLNKITQENINRLITHDVKIFGPTEGLQACGDKGPGRMVEPAEIVKQLECFSVNSALSGKRVIITAGPTQEPIDPIRYLSNHSSGKMGYALTEAALNAGAAVTLISGPTHLKKPQGAQCINVQSADEMLNAVLNEINHCDVLIGAAAVADYRITTPSQHKIKKNDNELTLNLTRNPDILARVSQLKQKPYMVGFAAETENIFANARQKLHSKNLDIIIVNQVGKTDRGFNSDNNQLTAIWSDGHREYSLQSKKWLAKELINLIAKKMMVDNVLNND